jgi:hypothetical protein
MSVETVLHAFLSRNPPEVRERLLRFLPEHSLKRMEHLSPFREAIDVTQFENRDLLEIVHWSWYLPTLKSYSLEEQVLFLSALEPSTAADLAHEIPCVYQPEELSQIGRSYLRQILLTSLLGIHDRLIPRELLPPSPLNRLLHLKKNQLIFLINLLSMYDLAAETRQIVETKTLKKIFECLTEREQKFLKQVSVKPEPYPLSRIGLEHWDGDRKTLRNLLHRRGIARLGLALSGEDPALIWYLCHQLDIGRGTVLFKHCVKEGGEGAIHNAAQQVEELLRDE